MDRTVRMSASATVCTEIVIRSRESVCVEQVGEGIPVRFHVPTVTLVPTADNDVPVVMEDRATRLMERVFAKQVGQEPDAHRAASRAHGELTVVMCVRAIRPQRCACRRRAVCAVMVWRTPTVQSDRQ